MDKSLKNKEDIDFIKEQLTLLFSINALYKNIFKKENEKVLDEFPFFFFIIQIIMIDYQIIGLSRLLDPYKQGKNKNLTIDTLIENLCVNDFDRRGQKSILEDIRNELGFLKEIRNKYLAHLDYKKAKKISKALKSDINKIKITIENIIKKLTDLLSYILDKEIIYGLIEQQLETETNYIFYILKNKDVLTSIEFLSTILSSQEKKEIIRLCKNFLDSYSPNLKERKEFENIVKFLN